MDETNTGKRDTMAVKRKDLPPSVQKMIGPKASMREVLQAEQLYHQGVTDGMLQSHGELINLLETKYMGEGRPDRGTPEAEAILTLAKELGNHLREKIEAIESANKN